MKWKTHRAITEKVLRRLGLDEEVIQACLEGVVEPDTKAGFSFTLNSRGRLRIVSKPHHSFWRSFDSLSYIYKARKYMLEGRYKVAAHRLGLALHYVQDRCIKEILFMDHEGLEAEAGRTSVPEEAISKGFRDSISNPSKVGRVVLWYIWPSWTPEVAVWNATYYTAYIAKAVFDLDARNFEKARVEKDKLFRWVKRLTLVLPLPVGVTYIAHISSLNILLPLIILDVLLLMSIAFLLDRIMKIKRWFGI